MFPMSVCNRMCRVEITGVVSWVHCLPASRQWQAQPGLGTQHRPAFCTPGGQGRASRMQPDWHCHGASLSLYIQNLDISRYYSCRYLQDFDFLYTFMVKFLWFISFYDRTRRWNAGCRIRGINDLNAWYILHKWWGKCSDMLCGASH